VKKTLNNAYKEMVSLQNDFSNESSNAQLVKNGLNIDYKKMVSLQNEFSHVPSDL
jgi:hypothetical protein